MAQLTGSANEAGLPGEDDLFGDGILNVGRIETNSSGQASDTAAAGFYLQPIEGSENMLLYFSGENRGSETIGKVEMTVSYPGFEKTYLFNDIESSQTFYETLVLSPSDSVILEEQEITINVKPADGDGDISNNSKAVKIRLSSAE